MSYCVLVCVYVCIYHLLLVLAGLLTQHFSEELLEFLHAHLLVLEQEKTKWFLYKRVAWCLKHCITEKIISVTVWLTFEILAGVTPLPVVICNISDWFSIKIFIFVLKLAYNPNKSDNTIVGKGYGSSHLMCMTTIKYCRKITLDHSA